MYAVTGATGHLGQALLRLMKSRGEHVRAVIRSSSNREVLAGLCDEIVVASLDDVDSLREAFAGMNTVIHSAALIDIRRGNMDEMHRVNVGGSMNVLKACRKEGIRRLVHIASIEAIDLSDPRRPVDESHGFARGTAVMEYGETKAEAARFIAAAGLESDGPETVVICPTTITGPWDFHNGLLTTMVRRHLAGRIPATIPGGIDYVDVRDVAGLILSAAEKANSGETYLAAGSYLNVPQLLRTVEEAAGIRRHTPPLPLWLAVFAGEVSELWSRISGRRVLFTRGSVDVLQSEARIDRSKPERDLGYNPRPPQEAIRDMVEWIQGREDFSPAVRF